MDKATKNDLAWEQLFERHRILEVIAKQGYYPISAREINKVRESRLMAKFDQQINLPHIFRANRLAILPVSRSSYLVGRFNAYQPLPATKSEVITLSNLPVGIESIDCSNIYSESAALHFAYLTGVIDNLLGAKASFTISGRMSTASFDFRIKDLATGEPIPVSVENSQCEIDAGFETMDTLLLVEAKNFAPEDFNIRQLYYPYRLWSSKVHKQVLPTLMTCSNDHFSFYIFQFTDPLDYNSLKLVRSQSYLVAPEQITRGNIKDLLDGVQLVDEPELPFPQADKFEREIDLLALLFDRDQTREEITQNYQFGVRQSDYYANAAIYLGLVRKYRMGDSGEISYSLTKKGREIMGRRYRQKYLSLAQAILEHETFHKVCRLALELGHLPDRQTTCQLMHDCNLYHIDKETSTLTRRAQTVLGWVSWILGLGGKLW